MKSMKRQLNAEQGKANKPKGLFAPTQRNLKKQNIHRRRKKSHAVWMPKFKIKAPTNDKSISKNFKLIIVLISAFFYICITDQNVSHLPELKMEIGF